MSDSNTIARLNDEARKNFLIVNTNSFRSVITSGVEHFASQNDGDKTLLELAKLIHNFDDFNEDNDPNEERDFFIFNYLGVDFNFSIDYYDKSLNYGSENPADPSVTHRVMTLMLPIER